MNFIKYFLVFFYLSLFLFFLNSEILILNNGNLLLGDLIKLNNDNILFKFNNKNYEFNLKNIDQLISDSLEENNIKLSVTTPNYTDNNLTILKLNNLKLYHVSKENLFEFHTIDFNNILKIYQTKNNYDPNEQIFIFKNINFYNIKNSELLIDFLIKNIDNQDLNVSNINQERTKYINQKLEIHDISFYENFWKRFENLINKDTKQILWNLLEQYSDEEKIFNVIYKENTFDLNKDESVIKIENLRNDFYRRVVNILLFNELIFKNNIIY